jgi:rRNA maturation protein Nop10
VGLFPEGNHIQLVFYRRHLDDQDVLVKVLVDGKAITLPLPTKQSPYYKWSTFRTYCLKRLELLNERREKP